jgi:hypothetical protein
MSARDVARRVEPTGSPELGLKASLRKSGRILDIREEVKAEKTLDLVIGYKGPSA